MDSLFKTKNGKVVLSVLWGLGIAALFYKVCESSGCFVMNEHSTPDVESNIYEFRNECFNGNGGPGCGPVYPDAGPQRYPPKCDHPLFLEHPPIQHYEYHTAKNCGDPRHCREPSCYKFNPMDSIFRAPSSQIYYPYH
jgi:hypothetical protein